MYSVAMQKFLTDSRYWGGEPEAIALSSLFRGPRLPFRRIVIYVQEELPALEAAGAQVSGLYTFPSVISSEAGAAEKGQLTVLRRRSHYLSLIRRGLVDGNVGECDTRDRLARYAWGALGSRERPGVGPPVALPSEASVERIGYWSGALRGDKAWRSGRDRSARRYTRW